MCRSIKVLRDYDDPLFPVADTPIGRIGCAICYDWLFPEAIRQLAANGAAGLEARKPGRKPKLDAKDKQLVAVKILANAPDYEEFEKELEILCTVRSPSVCYFYGACISPTTYCLVNGSARVSPCFLLLRVFV
jgi:hypothetical protein